MHVADLLQLEIATDLNIFLEAAFKQFRLIARLQSGLPGFRRQ